MSIVEKQQNLLKKQEEQIRFAISDTELILSLFLEASFNGKDVERAAETLGKMKKLHHKLMQHRESIN